MDKKADKIPEIPPIPPEISNILNTGQFVIFIGAGVSCLLGYPTWEQLSDAILDKMAKDKNIPNFSYADIDSIRSLRPRQKISIAIDICRANKKDISKLLKETMIPANPLRSDIYDLLVSIPTNFITTNYDNCLYDTIIRSQIKEGDEEYVTQMREVNGDRLIRYFNKRDLTNDKLIKFGNIFHLHGNIDSEETLVLATRDYVEHYQDESVISFLDHLFDNYTVLFIGYGLEEEEILEYVIRKKQAEREIRHFRLFPVYSHQSRLLEHLTEYYQSQCGIKLISYQIDARKHNQLEEVLKVWLPQLKTNIRPAGFISTVETLLNPVLEDGRT